MLDDVMLKIVKTHYLKMSRSTCSSTKCSNTILNTDLPRGTPIIPWRAFVFPWNEHLISSISISNTHTHTLTHTVFMHKIHKTHISKRCEISSKCKTTMYIYICDYIWLRLCNKATYLAGKRISILLDISKYCNIWYLAVTFEVSIHSQLCPKLLTHEIPKRRTCQSPLDYRD